MNALSIHLVTNCGDKDVDTYLSFVARVVDGGATCVQLREKNTEPKRLLAFSLRLQQLLKARQIPLIINDDPLLARAIDADGLHLGQKDGCPQEARELLGEGKIIGLSLEDETQIEAANKLQCINYVGYGPVFLSRTKQADHIIGINGLRRAVIISRHPLVAIGGINAKNVARVFETGCVGIAAVAAFHESEHPETTVRTFSMERLRANLNRT